MTGINLEALLVARKIADFAEKEKDLRTNRRPRVVCKHMGAVLADAVLQAGLNYHNVVRPRVLSILNSYPDMDRVSSLSKLVEKNETASFLNWVHEDKILRFERIVRFLKNENIELVADLHSQLASEKFRKELLCIKGVGPKTADYMACLVGVESIPVDRHVRSLALSLGITNQDYQFLQKVFCYAADFLGVPRREFDEWIWQRQTQILSSGHQLKLAV